MASLRFTLLTDGSSDRALLPILSWLLQQCGLTADVRGQWADFRALRHSPNGLHERILCAIDLYPCELLFIHRDAEGQGFTVRVNEITQALAGIRHAQHVSVPSVFVIPVRMQEAWLLIDTNAIRRASGNPSGRVQLDMPQVDRIEAILDPKDRLHGLLRTASGLTGRKLRKLNLPVLRYRVAELIADFGPLRHLPAFSALERDLINTVEQNHWA